MKALARGCVVFTINHCCVFPSGLGFLGGESCQAEEEREAGMVQLFPVTQFPLFPLAATMPPSVTSQPPVVTSEPLNRPRMDVLLLWGFRLKFRSDVIVCLLKMSGVSVYPGVLQSGVCKKTLGDY